jgi:phytoene dehydrogenase-like protein
MEAMMARTAGIVGGGIAGLIAATQLARAGVEVTLVEAAHDLGGRARTRQGDGFSLNQGPHALYIKGAFRQALKGLSIAFSGAAPALLHAHCVFETDLFRLPTSLASLATTRLFTARDKLQFAALLKAIADGASLSGSFAHWLDERRARPRVRAALEALARLTAYANAPEEMSATAALDQIRLGLAGVLYVDGGWATLVEGLKQAASAAGVDLRTGAPVVRVEATGETARILLADGERLESDAILLAIGPCEAAHLAPEVASLKEAALGAIPIRANSLDLALDRLPDGAHTFAQGIDQPFYLSVHSLAGKLAPKGGAMVHVSRYLAAGEAPRANAIEELELYADLAMPGWRAFEKKRQTLRGIAVANAVVRWDQPRPGVRLADAPGVFIAGDWVGATGMLSDAAAASALQAAAEMVRHFGSAVGRAA